MRPDWRMSVWLTAMLIITAVWLAVAITLSLPSEPEPEIGTAMFCEVVGYEGDEPIIECEERS